MIGFGINPRRAKGELDIVSLMREEYYGFMDFGNPNSIWSA
jgi:hypothetical protein